FSALRSKLSLLDRADAADFRNLVFVLKFTAALASQSIARLPRRDCFFYGDLQLARRAWRFVPKLFSARAVIVVVDLSRAPFRFLELADRIHKTKGVHRVMAQLTRRICGRVRVGDSRMDAWLALQRFWLERSRRCPPRRVANDSSR